jgi:chromosome segregation ATPase
MDEINQQMAGRQNEINQMQGAINNINRQMQDLGDRLATASDNDRAGMENAMLQLESEVQRIEALQRERAGQNRADMQEFAALESQLGRC